MDLAVTLIIQATLKNVVDDDDDDDTSLISAEVPRRDYWQPHVLDIHVGAVIRSCNYHTRAL